MTVLVVGATGMTGRALVEQLLSKGHHVRAIVRSPRKLPAKVRDHPNATVIEARVLDLTDEETAERVKAYHRVGRRALGVREDPPYRKNQTSVVLLPNSDRAVIDPVKLHGYFLSTAHPLGRFKARFFAALGFVAERWSELEPHGQFFTIRAMLKGPTGASAVVVSVWLVQTGEGYPRCVTAYPGGAN